LTIYPPNLKDHLHELIQRRSQRQLAAFLFALERRVADGSLGCRTPAGHRGGGASRRLCSQIVPSGATPGAREAHALYFIDQSLMTYFAGMAPDYRTGLKEFQSQFAAANAGRHFGAVGPEVQMAFLKTADRTPFFETTRMLTVLGMFSSPKYGGNFQGSGWKLMGFVDQHAFAPPFGYYDAQYTGFVPYPTGKPV
jgi:gluconate 2-dehydrogenase gamma chain